MKTENYIEKIPFVAELNKMETDELHELFNGFETIGNEMPFEFTEMMEYFHMKKQKKTIISIAMDLNISKRYFVINCSKWI